MSKLIKMILNKESAKPGLLACGPYLVGTVCKVPVDEAVRLSRFKGFVCAGTKADATALKKAVEGTVNAEAEAAAEEASKASESHPEFQAEE